jgi:hypothetical protein
LARREWRQRILALAIRMVLGVMAAPTIGGAGGGDDAADGGAERLRELHIPRLANGAASGPPKTIG